MVSGGGNGNPSPHYRKIMNKTIEKIIIIAVVYLLGVSVGLIYGYKYGISGHSHSYLPETRLEPNQVPLSKQNGLERKLVRFRVTAYCADSCCCGEFADGITASGHKIERGDRFVAAPKAYKFGTIMDVPDYGRVKELDRGGAIKGNRIDLYMPSHQAALNYGGKYLYVEGQNE